jgi:hypothetical protein
MPTARRASGGDRHLKFHETRDNIRGTVSTRYNRLEPGGSGPEAVRIGVDAASVSARAKSVDIGLIGRRVCGVLPMAVGLWLGVDLVDRWQVNTGTVSLLTPAVARPA